MISSLKPSWATPEAKAVRPMALSRTTSVAGSAPDPPAVVQSYSQLRRAGTNRSVDCIVNAGGREQAHDVPAAVPDLHLRLGHEKGPVSALSRGTRVRGNQHLAGE